MAHDPVLSPYVPRVDRTPAAVREALDPSLRAAFDAEYWPALRSDEQARGRPSAVAQVVEKWWAEAVSCAQPVGRAARLAAEGALAAGQAVEAVGGDD